MVILPEWAAWLALAVMTVGLLGIALPMLPGVALIWGTALAYGILERFSELDPLSFALITVLALLGLGADFLLSQAGGRLAGASWRALAGGVVLGLVGLLFGLIFGGIGAVPTALLCTVLGVFLVEYYQRRNFRGAAKASAGWLAGCLVSKGVQMMIGLGMIAIFAWQVLGRG